jgi:cobaltochelatase CobN
MNSTVSWIEGLLLRSGGLVNTVNEDRDYPLKTKRLVVGQITICRGCCCGNTERELPGVPVEWLKNEWRKRGLLKRVQLTISGCVGPCDVPNVVVVTSSSGTEWLGRISKFEQYRNLLEWAVRCRDAGEMLALPLEFHGCRITPFGR